MNPLGRVTRDSSVPGLSVRPSLDICMIFDDAAALERAHQVRRHIVKGLGGSLELLFSLWPIAELSRPQIWEWAGAAAAHADVLLFSMHSGRAMTPAVATWLDATLARRDDQGRILFALLESGTAAMHSPSWADECLRRCTRTANVDFLSHREARQSRREDTRLFDWITFVP